MGSDERTSFCGGNGRSEAAILFHLTALEVRNLHPHSIVVLLEYIGGSCGRVGGRSPHEHGAVAQPNRHPESIVGSGIVACQGCLMHPPIVHVPEYMCGAGFSVLAGRSDNKHISFKSQTAPESIIHFGVHRRNHGFLHPLPVCLMEDVHGTGAVQVIRFSDKNPVCGNKDGLAEPFLSMRCSDKADGCQEGSEEHAVALCCHGLERCVCMGGDPGVSAWRRTCSARWI